MNLNIRFIKYIHFIYSYHDSRSSLNFFQVLCQPLKLFKPCEDHVYFHKLWYGLQKK